jgi:hypothetical protein
MAAGGPHTSPHDPSARSWAWCSQRRILALTAHAGSYESLITALGTRKTGKTESYLKTAMTAIKRLWPWGLGSVASVWHLSARAWFVVTLRRRVLRGAWQVAPGKLQQRHRDEL